MSFGDVQTYAASCSAVLFTIVNSNWWTAGIAVLSAVVLVIRLIREIKELIRGK